MDRKNVEVWERRWSYTEKIKFDINTKIIFKNIAKEISFKGKKVLELGCGSGRLSYLAYQAGAEGITLVDFSEKALEIARNLFKGNDKVNFIKGDLLNAKLPKKYDIVFSSGVVEHFKEEELLRAIKVHAEFSKEYVLVVVPSNTIFNNRRSISPENIKLYGYQKPIHRREMEMLFKRTGINTKCIRRFHSMYGVPLPSIPGIRIVRTLLTYLLKPLDPFVGGLLLGVGKTSR